MKLAHHVYHLSMCLFYCNDDLRLRHTSDIWYSYALNLVIGVQMEQLEEAGIKKVVCLAVAEPEQVSEWANKVGLSNSKIETWADTKGAWTRMLGLDENQFDAPGPRSQRYVSCLHSSQVGQPVPDIVKLMFVPMQVCWSDRQWCPVEAGKHCTLSSCWPVHMQRAFVACVYRHVCMLTFVDAAHMHLT